MIYTIKTLNENGAQYFSFWSVLGNVVWDSYFANAKLFTRKSECLKQAELISKVTETNLVIVSQK